MSKASVLILRLAAGLGLLAPANARPPDRAQLARFQQKVREDMTGLPNYTCLETIERSRRAPPLEFQPVDILRVEVSTVAGKELFARPGGRFGERDLASLVSTGTVGTGIFSTFVGNLFVSGKGSLKYHGADNLAGRRAVRYEFRLTKLDSGFKVAVANYSENVAAKGSFWYDPDSLELLRLEVHGENIPDHLHVNDAFARVNYARTRIGDSDALLPKRAELIMTYFSGVTNRNAIEFSHCHAYSSESKITFDSVP